MGRFHFCQKLNRTWICVLTLLPLALSPNSAQAITASIGRPYHGHLINGIPFPRQFRGYHLRQVAKTYTTPEVIGALLDAIEAIHKQFPKTCDLYLGDFSQQGGGWLDHHRSHQNGRDVDVGMFAKNNRYLDRFIPMNRQNLDVPKTWQLIEDILGSQRVQYIFLDRRIQALLHTYALSRGGNPAYLDRLFGNVRGAVIQHIPGHRDHMHVRFFTPWSTMAGQLQRDDRQKRAIIELAQQAYLPKQVRYYVSNSSPSLATLAQSFGVNRMDLCRWNHLRSNQVLSPGTCLVFYKRGFELEQVHLAESLQPKLALEPPPLRLAALKPETVTLRDLSMATQPRDLPVTSTPQPRTTAYKVKRGDTLTKVAKHHRISLGTLCRLNGLTSHARLRSGQILRIPERRTVASTTGKRHPRTMASRSTAAKSSGERRYTTYKVRTGDTLWGIANRNGLDLETLCKINRLRKTSTLHVGQALRLTERGSASRASTKTSGRSSRRQAKVYTIRSGDSLWAVAHKYGTSPERICQVNGISLEAALHPGMEISLP